MGGIISSYISMWKNFANFSGRISRKAFWLAFLGNFIVCLTAGLVLGLIGGILAEVTENDTMVTIATIPLDLYSLAILIPSISMAVRRFHDIGKPGWWVALCYLGNCCCGLGGIALIVFACMPGVIGPNEYGNDPNMNGFNTNGQQFNNQQYGQQQYGQQQYGQQQYGQQQFNNQQYGQQQFNNQQYGQQQFNNQQYGQQFNDQQNSNGQY